jgi:tetratricopeptide (TPR) repeat protein
VTERQLRSWQRLDLVRKAAEYDWADLKAVQTLAKISRAGFGPKRIQRAIDEIQRKLRGVRNPLSELNVVVDHGRIHVQIDGHRMEAVSGQLALNFDADQVSRLLSFPTDKQERKEQRKRSEEAADWFQRGLEIEQSGLPLEQAKEAYEKALELDPNCLGALINLGTVYYQTRNFKRAEAFYRKALELEPEYALAHFNLGNLFDERSDHAEAYHHYTAALRIAPNYSDAHYNLALLCQRTNQTMKAVRHWQAYLKLDPSSSWADVARRELAKLRDAAVVKKDPPSRVS